MQVSTLEKPVGSMKISFTFFSMKATITKLQGGEPEPKRQPIPWKSPEGGSHLPGGSVGFPLCKYYFNR